MSEKPKVLKIFNNRGGWIERPDLYLLARMSVEEKSGEALFQKAYRYMSEFAGSLGPTLDAFDKDMAKRGIENDFTGRRYAAMVVSEMIRLKASGDDPTLARALKLVTHHFKGEEKAHLDESSVTHMVKTAFSKWRNTSHLEAALRIGRQNIEMDHQALLAFLGNARAIEAFIDQVCDQTRLSWNPWRVPSTIAPEFKLEVVPLSAEERQLLR